MSATVAKLTQNELPKTARSTSLWRIYPKELIRDGHGDVPLRICTLVLSIQRKLGSHQCVPDDEPCLEYSDVIKLQCQGILERTGYSSNLNKQGRQ